MNNQSRSSLHRGGNNRNSIPKKVLKIVLLFVLSAVFTASAYAFKTYTDVGDTALSIFHPLKKQKQSTAVINEKPISLLLMGLDNGTEERKDDAPHSDTMIVATVNQKKAQTTLVSIPRDTLAELQGDVPENTLEIQKINAAFTVGGPEMSVATVKSLLNIPIDYYITVDMTALAQIVSAVGGVDVQVPFDFNYDNQYFTKGQQHLNGDQALAYARMRHDDPEGDYGRQKRQQQVIQSLIKSAISVNTLAHFSEILETVKSDIKTNLTFDDMKAIYQKYQAAGKKVKNDHLQGLDAWIGDGSYQVASPTELNRVSTLLRTQLDLQEEPLDNEEINQFDKNPNFTGIEPNNIFRIYTSGNNVSSSYGSSKRNSSSSSDIYNTADDY